jgi:hypothetical protein
MRRSVVVIGKTVEPGWARALGRSWREWEGSNERASITIVDVDVKKWILFVKERNQ